MSMTTSDLWHAWTADTPDDIIVEAFTRRYGHPPARIVRERGLALAGPAPEPIDAVWQPATFLGARAPGMMRVDPVTGASTYSAGSDIYLSVPPYRPRSASAAMPHVHLQESDDDDP